VGKVHFESQNKGGEERSPPSLTGHLRDRVTKVRVEDEGNHRRGDVREGRRKVVRSLKTKGGAPRGEKEREDRDDALYPENLM